MLIVWHETADMDDTLVLTADADAASHAAVLDIMRECDPGIDADKVLERWKRLFRRAPWDDSHEARRYNSRHNAREHLRGAAGTAQMTENASKPAA